MSLISVNNLTFGYDGSFNNIFENVSFNIDTDWKLGLIGRNGKGKTTFLKLLQGEYEYKGTITKNVDVDYFPFDVDNKDRMSIEIVNEISIVQERILLEQSRNIKDILTLNWLKENVQILIEEINDYLSKHETWKGYQMLNISKIEDLVNKGNNFYSFMVFSNEDEEEWQWYVEVNYKDNELQIDRIMPCI